MSHPGLAPEWAERLKRIEAPLAQGIDLPPPPLARPHLTGGVHRVATRDQADRLVQACSESPVSWIGIDTEYRYQSERPLYVRGEKEVWDIRSLHPFCLAFALVSRDELIRFVVDLRIEALRPAVQHVLDLPVEFVAHRAQAELFVFWSLGLREPGSLWDTCLAERALGLGTGPPRAAGDVAGSDAEAIRLQRGAEQERERRLALDQVAARYGVPTDRVGHEKQRLQRSFLTKPCDEALSGAEIEYCARDAQAAAEIYPHQRRACDRAGITATLDRVVMPWNVTAAEIAWAGVLFDRSRCRRFLEQSAGCRARIARQLRQHGIANPGSAPQLAAFLRRHGLDRHFPRTKTGAPCTAEAILKGREDLHPALRLVRQWRKVRQLAEDPAVRGLLDAADGRVHAEFRVLEADTGRTQSRRPNLMGLGRVFRPLVRAPEGFGIAEVDLAQIEPGVAAGVFRDPGLIEDYNQGDVYVALAKRIFRDQVAPADLDLDNEAFRQRYGGLRDRTKPLLLGLLYGMTIPGIARALKTTPAEARRLWDSFRRLYPTLCAGMERAREQSARRGYAYIAGLRRFRRSGGPATDHELRALGNAPVQGAAALVFYEAGNRLRRLLRAYGARIILPVHDSFVLEAPLPVLREAAELTRTVLTQTVQERFPELRPRADLNVAHPGCWNDGGRHDSLERFLEDPLRTP